MPHPSPLTRPRQPASAESTSKDTRLAGIGLAAIGMPDMLRSIRAWSFFVSFRKDARISSTLAAEAQETAKLTQVQRHRTYAQAFVFSCRVTSKGGGCTGWPAPDDLRQ